MPVTLSPEPPARTAATLAELAALCEQAEAGFRISAEQARADDVRALLRRRAEESRLQAADLWSHVRRLGGSAPAAMTSPPAWPVAQKMAQSVAPDHVDAALLDACERAEDAVMERFTDAQAQTMEPAARDALQLHRLEMRGKHELLRTLHDRLRGLL